LTGVAGIVTMRAPSKIPQDEHEQLLTMDNDPASSMRPFEASIAAQPEFASRGFAAGGTPAG